MDFEIKGQIINILEKSIFKGKVKVLNDKILEIVETDCSETQFILPGFIDSHVHIESSMLIPSEFARLAVLHGTVATVSDPHEIANVLGLKGVNFMVENGKTVPFKFYFGAPSCVPATNFETAGSTITAKEIEELFQNPDIKYLAEMMNWPGVIFNDSDVYEKINLAKRLNKHIDGHAPGLRGEQIKKYVAAGISTDHESIDRDEALEKLDLGMKILIREGSAAKNFEALIELLNDFEDRIMFCSDDKHPDALIEGHINELVKRALKKGTDIFKVLKAACVNPVKHYGLDVGLLQKGDSADFIVVDNLEDLNVLETYINGKKVAENGKSYITSSKITPINNFNISSKSAEDFRIIGSSNPVKVIRASDGQLITECFKEEIPVVSGILKPSVEKDILKIAVVNRYKDAKPAIAFINGFGLKEGALASSIAHDSHNIVVVGVDDISITEAVNEVIRNKGGISAVYKNVLYSLPLPVAGLMSDEDGSLVAKKYTEMDKISKAMGSRLSAPFMTLSFMALLVIPSLKLSDKGLFDGEKFEFVDLQE